MSKLEELIKEFCPNGVEHVKLCAVADFRAGSSFPEREQGRKAGRYPFYKVVDMNKTQIYMEKANNYINEETCTKLKCKPAPKGTIIFPKVGATMGTNKKRILSIEACYDNNIMGLFAKNIDPKFLYYCFSKVDLLSLANGKGAVPSLDTEKMARIQIPLPALPVQREIVRILDSFTLYSAELTAELTARRKQYEFYRDKLLNFDSGNIQRVKLKDICGKVSNIKWQNDDNEYAYIDLSSVDRETHKITIEQRINKENAPSRAQQIVNKGDVLFATTRPTLKRYCKITEEFNGQICSTGFVVLRPNINIILSAYLYYIVSSDRFFTYVEKNQEGTSYPAISDSKVKEFDFSLPPMEVQERIVKVLDNFDAICSDLGIGLPAEIEKRQKQYEYYREKLLTFDMKSETILRQTDRQTGLIRLLQYVYGFAFVELESVLRIRNGKDYKHLGDGDIPVYGSGGIMAQVNTYIYDKPTVLIPRKGSIDKLYYIEKPFWNVDTIFYTEIDENFAIAKYVYYCLQKEHLEDYNTAGGVPSLTQTVLNKIVIPLPTIEKQKEIVEILDKFDSICNDLSAGLPAEIEYRQKRYEYYRDKLLRF